jgi:two-component sensor histidine kinase
VSDDQAVRSVLQDLAEHLAQRREIILRECIGLSIVKRLCELLDASLELDAAPGAGTTVRVSFPRSYADPRQA